MTNYYNGEVGPWPAFELREATPDIRGIMREIAPNLASTCDDGSEFFMRPEWVFYEAVLRHEAGAK